jgi:type VI secretion system secreted protein VgrG
VLGRLYNAESPPPNALPKDKVVSAFGTLTTPGGGSGNLVAMNDAAGAESMTFVASSDFNERTENDKVTSVTANEKASVGGNRKLIVGQVHKLGVAGAQTHAVGGSREVNVNANMSISAGSETIAIGGLRKFKVGGDSSTGCSSLFRVVGAAKVETAIEHQTRAVSGASAILVAGSWNAVGAAHASVSVGGASVEVVGGPKKVVTGKYFLGVKGALKQNFASRSVTAGASHDEGFNGAASYDISGSASFKGADVIIAADSKLTVKASGITIEITPGAVTIDGKFDGTVASVDQGDEKYA